MRKKENITQEEMAKKLNVSRQAISNWENGRNLPDVEMLIEISKTFHISLDELLLKGEDMNDITRKIIHDGSENQRAKRNLYSIMIGTFLLLMGDVYLYKGELC
ncbi:MAG: helix-turn-helix transcriptional regulator [Erysipelotrichaceae bacterium]|nr:helix-turn-helix transcriptional regulator [Erysipelotrichaceae bacterium]